MNTFKFWELFFVDPLGGSPECSRKEELTVHGDSYYLLSFPLRVCFIS